MNATEMQNRTLHKTKQHTLTTLNNRATHKTTKHYYEQFGTRVAATSKAATNEVYVSMVANNQRLENELTE